MDLRRRNKQHVMETMEGKTPAPRAHEFACAHGDFHVDGMDNIDEGRDKTRATCSWATTRRSARKP